MPAGAPRLEVGQDIPRVYFSVERLGVPELADTWVRKLRYPETLYTEVDPRDLLSHLQAGCTGRHALDLLALHNEIQRYHLEVEGIPESINMLEDAQRQAGWAGRAISDKNLLLFASTAMLTSERFPRANYAWEDRAEVDKTWEAWKLAYKQAHAKARVKAQTHGGSTKFGAANSAAPPEAQLPLDTQHEGAGGDMKYPSREFMVSPDPSCCVFRGSWASGRAAEFAAPNFMLPPWACALTRALAWACL